MGARIVPGQADYLVRDKVARNRKLFAAGKGVSMTPVT